MRLENSGKYIVDTHALIWHLEGNRLLGSFAKAIISAAASELILPIIALAEDTFVERAEPVH